MRSVEVLFSMAPVDLLVLHFGTSIGWPSLAVRMQDRFGIKFSSEFGFHQPIKHESAVSLGFKIRKFVKLKLKNFIKYLLLIFGLYRPKVSIREIHDQIDAVISLASARAREVYWIQHRAFQDSHTVAERFFYRRYYSKIVEKVKDSSNPKIKILEIPDSFVIRENYLNDWVHLSHLGHQRLAEMVSAELKKSSL